MPLPRALLFDLDDTLAESFELPTPEIIERVMRMLDQVPVAIITGRDFPWMERSFLPALTLAPHVDRFFLFPEGAAQCLQWNGTTWKDWYAKSITPEERERIRKAVETSVRETNVLDGLAISGAQFVQKRAMVAFAALGVEVPGNLKYSWDPDNARRRALRDAIAAKLPEFDVLMGGATSIDVTEKGINKSYGVRWLSEHLRIPASEMLYIGDALFPGGNDEVVKQTGIQTQATKGPSETAVIIDSLLAQYQAAK
ncbi:HAD-IIB family hydrolase [Candidatus Kaiserbacteria bacterium]|nr:HAD-IIB family hydrolase [Candidatus Kaiserbacteria bacterium]